MERLTEQRLTGHADVHEGSSSRAARALPSACHWQASSLASVLVFFVAQVRRHWRHKAAASGTQCVYLLLGSAGASPSRLVTSIRQLGMVMCLCFVCGCNAFDLTKSFDLSKRIPWMDPDIVEPNPTRITALWTHTVLNQQGHKGVRGFGGRIMFHGKDNDKPVRVEGSITVYAFDESNHTSTIPERKFVFSAEQFENHYSKSKLGHSYSIWLPWDEVGGEPRRISLMARFEPTNGGMITSETSLQVLPGITPEQEYDASAEPKRLDSSSNIEQAGYQEPSKQANEGQSPNRVGMATSDTIDLPPNFGRRYSSLDLPMQPLQIKKKLLTEPARLSASATDEDRDGAKSADSKDQPGLSSDGKSTDDATPQMKLKERQKELSDHFGRRKSQVQKASPARSKPAPLPLRQSPAVAPSVPPPSSSLEETDPFESDPVPDSAGSR